MSRADNKHELSYYDRQIALWHVRAYKDRLKLYNDTRTAIASTLPAMDASRVAVQTSPGLDSTVSKAALLEALDRSTLAQQIKAVDNALDKIGTDIIGKRERDKLRRGLILNINDRKHYPYYRLGIDFVSYSTFKRLKTDFLILVLWGINQT